MKIIKFILCTLILSLIFFLILDYIAYLIIRNDQFNNEVNYKLSRKNYVVGSEKLNYRPALGTQYDKKSIIFFGCSYAYGSGVKNEDTLPGVLSRYTKRPVYNIGNPGKSIQHAYLEILSGKYNEIIKNSDYAVYILIGDHLFRTLGIIPYNSMQSYPTLDIIKKGTEPKLRLHSSKIPFIEYSYLFYYLKRSIITRLLNNRNKTFEKKYFDIIKTHFYGIKTELNKINPNIKMIIIICDDTNFYDNFLHNYQWKKLRKNNISVINIKENIPAMYNNENNKFDYCYIADEYCVNGTNSGDDGHPNEKAWLNIADLLVNKLKLID